ncbi:MAG: Asp-tRNA(Asn)/Glu-tRNA(Gln) amidotransferase subunit GatA [Planctomycetes bacterium]|nr:Asp-tRNA(Asn)/Glu-tRNA(Gln) amidotransferase subunit GatA [Planctomycetota bacterium]
MAAAVRDGRRTIRDVAEETLGAIEHREGEVHAFLHLDPAEVRARADALDAGARAGAERGPLFGVPVALKDNLTTRDAPTTCGSRILEGYRAPYDAFVVERLREAGALLVGKTNLDEFAMGSSTERSAYGPTRNPLDATRVPGGSSGGSAAAVAALFVPLSLGSDTGGSIRQPAAFCGIVGMKPTYGRVSRRGLVAFASSLDQIGVFARNVRDAARLLEAIAGPDPSDATCLAEPPEPYERLLPANPLDALRGLRVGLPVETFPETLDARMGKAVRNAGAVFEKNGARLVEVRLPLTRYGIPTYCLIAFCEASANLARYDGVRYGPRGEGGTVDEMMSATRGALFGPEVKRRILLGTFALSEGYAEAYYGQAQRVRTRIRREYADAFERCDVLLTPATPGLPFPLGARSDPVSMYLEDLFTVGPSLAGLPALSLPCAQEAGSKLRAACQLIAPLRHDARLLAAAAGIEAALGPNLPAY